MVSDKFDLEHFPTSPAAKRMLSRVSPVYDRSYVGKWLFEVMGLELDEARKLVGELRLQAFPETATWGLKYWEQRYGIPPRPDLNDEARRQKVLARRNIKSPMSPARVEMIISAMTGKPVTTTENVAPYTFRVMIEDVTGGLMDGPEVYACLRRIKPSHQQFELATQAREHKAQMRAAHELMSVSTTHLPEWRLDYNFGARLAAVGMARGIGETTLPPMDG